MTIVAVIVLLATAVYLTRSNLLRHETEVTDPAVVQRAARELAVLTQTASLHPEWFDGEPALHPAWTPAVVSNLHPTWVNVSPKSARVEFGGGFHHFGYNLAETAPATYTLTFYSEDSSDRTLTSVTLRPEDVLSETEFVDRTIAELERRIAANQDARVGGSDDAFATVQRTQFLIKHGQLDRLKQLIRDSAAKNPDAWRDVLVRYRLDLDVDPTIATDQLRQWARGHADFSAWLLAAYAFDEAGDSAASADAVTQACNYPADDPEWISTNARFRGYAMCRRLYTSGQFAACTKLCQTLQAYTGSQNYLAGELAQLADAASRQQTAALAPAAQGVTFDPFSGIDVDRLRQSSTTRPTSPRTTGVR